MKEKFLFQILCVVVAFMLVSSQVAAVIPIGSILSDQAQSPRAGLDEDVTTCFFDEDDEEYVCITRTLDIPVTTARQTITTPKVNVQPNEIITANLDVTLPNYAEITNARIVFKYAQYGNVVRSIEFTSMVKGQAPSSTASYSLTLLAPSLPGDYELSYEVKGRRTSGASETVLSTSSISIRVGGEGCPPGSSTPWVTIQSIPNGVWKERTVTTVHADCTTTSTKETKTVCDTGFYVEGHSSSTTEALGTRSCVSGATPAIVNCAYCSGNSLVPYSGYMRQVDLLSEQEFSWWDNLLIRLGLKTFEREAVAPDVCSLHETTTGEQLLPNSNDVMCRAGTPVPNLDYFKPEVTGVYLEVDGHFVEVELQEDGLVAIPPRFVRPENGFIEGGRINLIIGVSNAGAKPYDEKTLSPELRAELDENKVGWIRNTIWRFNNWDKLTFGKEIYVASTPRSGGLEGDFEEGREAVITTTAGVVIGVIKLVGLVTAAVVTAEAILHGTGSSLRELSDSTFAKMNERQSAAVQANPILHRAIVEAAIYSPEAARNAYGYGRSSIPGELNIRAPTIRLVDSCQPGERDAGFVASADILMTPPILLEEGGLYIREYGDFSDPIDPQRSRIGKTGAVTEAFVQLSVKVPEKGDFTTPYGALPTNNYNPEGKYFLSVAVFDRCWTPQQTPTYVNRQAVTFNVNPEAVNPYPDMDCCKIPRRWAGIHYFVNDYVFVPRGTCVGGERTLIDPSSKDFTKCVEGVFDEDYVPCYRCAVDAEGEKTVETTLQYTAAQCLARNPSSLEKTHFLNQADAKHYCLDPGQGLGPECFSCTVGVTHHAPASYVSCPDMIINGKGYFAEQDDKWYEECEPSNAVACYKCDSNVPAGYSRFFKAGQSWFPVLNNDPVRTCESFSDKSQGLEIKHVTRVSECSEVLQLAIVNPADISQWCFVAEDEPDKCVPDQIFDRKISIRMRDMNLLDTIITKSSGTKQLRAEEVLYNKEVPVCLSAIGDVMCEAGSECVRALNTDAPSFRKNKQVYDALKTYSLTGFRRTWESTWGSINRWITGTSALEENLQDFGLCITEEPNPFDAFKSWIAALFNLDEDSPWVTAIVVLLIILVLVIIFMMASPRNKTNLNIGGGY